MRSWLPDEYFDAPERRVPDEQSASLSLTTDDSTAQSDDHSKNGLSSPLENADALRDPFFMIQGGASFEGEDIPAESIGPADSAAIAPPPAGGSNLGPASSSSVNVPAVAADAPRSVDPFSFTMINDSDGVASNMEARAANGGDGNFDAIADSLQADVASMRAAVGGEMVTIEAAGLQLRNVRAMQPSAELASRHSLPMGLFGFEVHGVARGGAAAVRLVLPEGYETNTYIKQDSTGAFGRFDFDGTTGAVFNGNVVTLHLVDGGRGDADGVANGVITDPGGPGDPTIVAAKIKEVTFAGTDLIPIVADPGTPSYPTGAQWLDSNTNGIIETGDRALPIGYPRNKPVVVSARFAITQTAPYYYSTNLMVKATVTQNLPQPVYFSIPWTTVTVSGDGTELIMAPVTILDPFPTFVNYGTLTLNWEFSNNGGESPVNAGTSANELYVTLAAPSTTPVYHTLLHLSIPRSATVPAGVESRVISETWKNFEARTITSKHVQTAWSGHHLDYYGQWDTPSQTAATLLTNLDGQCASMVDLFNRSLRAAGVNETLQQNVQVAALLNEGMLIKNWNFNGNGTANVVINGVTYEYQNQLSNPAQNPNNFPGGVGSFTRKGAGDVWEYYWGATVEVADGPGAHGQNTTNPKSHFSDHWIVRIDGKYYDPSYGTVFDSMQQWEDGSVIGFYTVNAQGANNYRLVFRKNPNGYDLQTIPPNA